jgi:hypothetical protein
VAGTFSRLPTDGVGAFDPAVRRFGQLEKGRVVHTTDLNSIAKEFQRR